MQYNLDTSLRHIQYRCMNVVIKSLEYKLTWVDDTDEFNKLFDPGFISEDNLICQLEFAVRQNIDLNSTKNEFNQTILWRHDSPLLKYYLLTYNLIDITHKDINDRSILDTGLSESEVEVFKYFNIEVPMYQPRELSPILRGYCTSIISGGVTAVRIKLEDNSVEVFTLYEGLHTDTSPLTYKTGTVVCMFYGLTEYEVANNMYNFGCILPDFTPLPSTTITFDTFGILLQRLCQNEQLE